MSNTTITPSVGALATAGSAGSVLSAGKAAVPPSGSLSAGGFIPGVANSTPVGPAVPSLLYLVGSPAQGAMGANSPQFWKGGAGVISVVGTFGSVSVQFQMLGPDNATWIAIGAAITTAGQASFSLPAGYIRVALSSGTGTTNITCAAQPVPTTLN